MPSTVNWISGFVDLLLFAFLGWLFLHVTNRNRAQFSTQQNMFFVALVVRYAFSVALYGFDMVRYLGDEDGSGWLAGFFREQDWLRHGMTLLDLPGIILKAYRGHHQGYGYLLGILFMGSGSPGRLPAAALNCFLGAMTVVFTYRIANVLFSPVIAVRAGWLACLMPSLVIWSAQTVKEPVVIFIEVVAIYCCIRMKTGGFSPPHLAVCLLCAVVVVPFRFYASFVILAAMLLTLVLPRINQRVSAFVSIVSLVAVTAALTFASSVLAGQEMQWESFDLNYVQSFRTAIAFESGSGVTVEADMHTPSGFVLATSVGAAHLLLAPFPWQLLGGSIRKLITVPELIFWWWLFFAAFIPGIRFAIRKRFSASQPLLVVMIGLLTLYSVLFGNVGLAYRQRAQLMPLFLVLAAAGLELRKIKKQQMEAPDYRQGSETAMRRKLRAPSLTAYLPTNGQQQSRLYQTRQYQNSLHQNHLRQS